MAKFLCTSPHVNYLVNISDRIRNAGQCYLLHLAFLGDDFFFNAGSIKLLSVLCLEIMDMKFCLVLDLKCVFSKQNRMIKVKQNMVWSVLVIVSQ